MEQVEPFRALAPFNHGPCLDHPNNPVSFSMP
jgi:hypothetical protein